MISLASAFIAWGAGIKAGVNVRRVRMTAIRATITKAFGFDDTTLGNGPMHQMFR